MLSQEAGRADRNRHYGLYIDGDIAKLPGGRFSMNIDEPKDVLNFFLSDAQYRFRNESYIFHVRWKKGGCSSL